MANSINWLGNKVVDTNPSAQPSRMTTQERYRQNSDTCPQAQQPMQPIQPMQPMQPMQPSQPSQLQPIQQFPMQPTDPVPPDFSGTMFPPPIISSNRQGPPLVFDRNYIPGYLASNIGKNVRAEFVIGNSQYVDKTGKLYEVGVNYFVLEDINSGTLIMCDLYSVKFVTIIR